MATKTKRPKWAEKLSASQWRALRRCQNGTPTLKQLRADVQWQQEHGMPCFDCHHALRTVTED